MEYNVLFYNIAFHSRTWQYNSLQIVPFDMQTKIEPLLLVRLYKLPSHFQLSRN